MTTTSLPILYKEARTGKLHSWQIWTEGADMVEEYGTVEGEKTTNRRTCEGKNIGKKNETTPEDQAAKEAAAKHQKKLDKGYRLTKDAAKETVFLPMLAHDYNKLKKAIEFPVDVQPKLDGVRCLARMGDEDVNLMSRGGKEYVVHHITDELRDMLSPKTVLDGELYVHGMPLQDINALVKKHREEDDPEYPGGSVQLEYWVYDGFHEECTHHTWERRRDDLVRYMDGFPDRVKVRPVPTFKCKSEEQLFEFLDRFLEEGYEGAILRLPDGEYSLGHRSRNLLKLKKFEDSEFEIVGWYEAKGNDKGTVCWTCATPEGKEFRVRPMGTREQRAKWLEEADSYIGKMLTVKYQQLSKDGIPTGNTVGVAIREEGT